MDGSVEAQALEELHKLIRQLRMVDVPLYFLTHRSDGTVEVVVVNSEDAEAPEVKLIGYDRAIEYLQARLNSAWRDREGG